MHSDENALFISVRRGVQIQFVLWAMWSSLEVCLSNARCVQRFFGAVSRRVLSDGKFPTDALNPLGERKLSRLEMGFGWSPLVGPWLPLSAARDSDQGAPLCSPRISGSHQSSYLRRSHI